MSGAEADDPHAQLVRPFLDRKQPLQPMSPDAGLLGDGSAVRAYTMTGGRAHSSLQLEFETMLQATADGREALTAVRFERADIEGHHAAETALLALRQIVLAMRERAGVIKLLHLRMLF